MTAEPHHDSSDPAPRPGVDPDDIVLHDDEQTQAGAQVARAGPRRSGEPGEGGDDDPTLRPDPGGGPTIP